MPSQPKPALKSGQRKERKLRLGLLLTLDGSAYGLVDDSLPFALLPAWAWSLERFITDKRRGTVLEVPYCSCLVAILLRDQRNVYIRCRLI